MRPHHDRHSGRHSPHARQVGAALAAALCVTAAVAIWALITGSFDSTSERVLASAFAAAVATLSGLAGATVLGRADRRRVLGQATIAISGIALLLAGMLIWLSASADSEIIPRAFGISLAAMIACAHASLMYGRLRSHDGDGARVLTRIAVASACSAALLMSSLLLFVTDGVASGVWRLLGVLVVIAMLTTLLAPLARRIAPSTSPNRPSQQPGLR